MKFEEWWKDYLKDNLSCINYEKDFRNCWNARTLLEKEHHIKWLSSLSQPLLINYLNQLK